MAKLEVLQFPDPRLRVKAARVEKIDDKIRQIVEDMYETMYAENGVGLAATQVGINLQIFTYDASETRDQKKVIFNPEILSREGEWGPGEGCLSVRGAYDKPIRAERVRLRGMDINGNTFEMDAEGLEAHIFQHETDHLNGMLFIDHLSKLKFNRIKEKIKKHMERAKETKSKENE